MGAEEVAATTLSTVTIAIRRTRLVALDAARTLAIRHGTRRIQRHESRLLVPTAGAVEAAAVERSDQRISRDLVQ